MAVRTEHIDKWVRAYLDEVTVVDSRHPLLFWEERFPVPAYAFPRSDVRTDLLEETHADPPREPFFFLPKGPVSRWYDVTVGDRTVPARRLGQGHAGARRAAGPQLATGRP